MFDLSIFAGELGLHTPDHSLEHAVLRLKFARTLADLSVHQFQSVGQLLMFLFGLFELAPQLVDHFLLDAGAFSGLVCQGRQLSNESALVAELQGEALADTF